MAFLEHYNTNKFKGFWKYEKFAYEEYKWRSEYLR